MSQKVTIQEVCINCAVCEEECVPGAISAGSDVYVVDPDRCTLCAGEYPSPRCIEVCPIEDCVVMAG
jgi:ferredoxin